ncbi:uncharacterized protein JCM6883_001688 [Sporobolomyces salmoneus]|uniref:uncharacterized protein n=1 Tax=Sporobolomyces salmoneus TaxID=183962 RepID=UPI00317A4634
MVESIGIALPRLRQLSIDWEMATNGRLNASKTVAVAIGEEARAGIGADEVSWSDDEDFVTWAGFPFSPKGDTITYYELLLASLTKQLDLATAASFDDLRSRVKFLNTHIISRSLHVLSFSPPPESFLERLDELLLRFVWNSEKYQPLGPEKIFSSVVKGGLGLLNLGTMVKANCIRFMDRLLKEEEVIWLDLAKDSMFRSNGLQSSLPTQLESRIKSSFKNPLSLLSPSTSLPEDDKRWKLILSHARTVKIVFDFDALQPSELLSIPPSLFSPTPFSKSLDRSFREVNALGEIYYRSRSTLVPRLDTGLYTLEVDKTSKKVKEWNRIVATKAAIDNLSPQHPPSTSLLLPTLDSTDLARLWKWVQQAPATAQEVDTHWRILRGIIITGSKMERFGHNDTDLCVHCGKSDTVQHGWIECSYSKDFVEDLRLSLETSLSDVFSPQHFSLVDILLGLPQISRLVDADVRPRIRAIVAITVQTLHDARYERFRKENPTSSSLSPSSLATLVLQRISDRLS